MSSISIISLKQKALELPEPVTSLDIGRYNRGMLEKNVKKYSFRREE
ncbi:MAG: hypothetical protein RE471_04830 [Ferroplasma sp.]|jgi:hypothetical protein|nr:hypothetical protein [Ferroplasma sp.]WMT52206.1 MAG: hypothetical protein RE471_04830 [Ferroplasma sp.]